MLRFYCLNACSVDHDGSASSTQTTHLIGCTDSILTILGSGISSFFGKGNYLAFLDDGIEQCIVAICP